MGCHGRAGLACLGAAKNHQNTGDFNQFAAGTLCGLGVLRMAEEAVKCLLNFGQRCARFGNDLFGAVFAVELDVELVHPCVPRRRLLPSLDCFQTLGQCGSAVAEVDVAVLQIFQRFFKEQDGYGHFNGKFFMRHACERLHLIYRRKQGCCKGLCIGPDAVEAFGQLLCFIVQNADFLQVASRNIRPKLFKVGNFFEQLFAQSRVYPAIQELAVVANCGALKCIALGNGLGDGGKALVGAFAATKCIEKEQVLRKLLGHFMVALPDLTVLQGNAR